MPRVNVVSQKMNYPGLLPAHTAPIADGDVVDVGRCFLSVIVTTAPVTVTVQTPGTHDTDLAIAERTVVVPVGTVPTLIPLTSLNYKRAVGVVDAGRAYVDYSTPANVARAVVSL